VNPLNETLAQPAIPAPRLAALNGKRSRCGYQQAGRQHFLDRIEHLLKQRYGVESIIREMKPTFAKPAPPGILEKFAARMP